MKPLNTLTAETIMMDEVFKEVFDQEDEIYKARLLLSLEDRAAELGVKQKFIKMVSAYKKVEKEIKQQKSKIAISSLENWTNFEGPYERMYCGSWIATEDGIYSQNTGTADVLACRHPILPIGLLKNLETEDEQMKIAYKRKGRWFEAIIPKDILSSASKITSLHRRGISVTSENARCLVRYLQDVEDLNDDHINIQYSTGKLGWVQGQFIPYDTEIIFDGDKQFRHLFESIRGKGVEKIWTDHIKELRAGGRKEIKLMLAASFASVLVPITGSLPFIIDLWGETEGGKTVTLMVAASVWGNPGEHQYIGDFKSTDVQLEVRADMLNHLPMVLDDTSKVSSRIRDNFEGIVYDLCSGKGKSRSNKDLGVQRENTWECCFLTNGERPLSSYVNQGGALNRILEIECGENIFCDPQYTAELLKRNYGFAGRRFVDAVKEIGEYDIRAIQKGFQEKLFSSDKMQKQAISLSVILTADKIATDYIFQDGQYISMDDAKAALTDREILSDNERCYRFIMDKVAMNGQRFDYDTNCEKWGTIDKGYAVFYSQAFDELCKSGGFSQKSFLSWADKKQLLQTQGGRLTKIKKINGNSFRCVFLKLDNGEESENSEFVPVDEELQESLPFR